MFRFYNPHYSVCDSQREKAVLVGKMFFLGFTGFRDVYPFAVLVQKLVQIYSPLHSGDIAAFVLGSQTFEIRETEILNIRAPLHVGRSHAPKAARTVVERGYLS